MENEKEKAKWLVDKFFTGKTLYDEISWEQAKQCAIICCKEIIKEIPTEILDTYKGETNFINNDRCEYWKQVLTEIEKL